MPLWNYLTAPFDALRLKSFPPILVHDNTDDVLLTRGEHSLPFAVKIPSEEMPSSLEHRHGAIRYWVKVFVDGPGGKHLSSRYQPFTVLQKIDVGDPRFLVRLILLIPS